MIRPVFLATLAAGRWEGEPFVEGGAARPSLYYARDFRIAGDLDRDGGDEAVALLGANSGGSGEFAYIAVLSREGGSIDCVATAPLGDRVKVRGRALRTAAFSWTSLRPVPPTPCAARVTW